MDYLWNLFLKQDKRCALSGVRLKFGKNAVHHRYQTASIDRIDNTRGYTEGNVQWVHKHINRMKHVLNNEQFLKWNKLIFEYQTFGVYQ